MHCTINTASVIVVIEEVACKPCKPDIKKLIEPVLRGLAAVLRRLKAFPERLRCAHSERRV
jgi:hypothetical protein